MTKRALTILIVVAVFLAGAAVVIASSIGGSDSTQVHTLQDGSVHTGEMPTTEHMMDDGEQMDMGE